MMARQANQPHLILYPLWGLLVVMVIVHISFWLNTRELRSRWTNVPPAPSRITAAGAGLGDPAVAYRIHGTMLQNIGDSGGRTTNLGAYDYKRIENWFMLMHYLDPQSNFAPFLASFYYGSVKDPEKLRPLVHYLEIAGNSTQGKKWRWLAHGAYLAQFDIKDYDLALRLATKLSNLGKTDLPMWARNMRGSILNASGEKEAAYHMLLGILEDGAEAMHPNEVNATLAYICEQILDEEQAQDNPLCKDILPAKVME